MRRIKSIIKFFLFLLARKLLPKLNNFQLLVMTVLGGSVIVAEQFKFAFTCYDSNEYCTVTAEG
jgi:hypothetical protein